MALRVVLVDDDDRFRSVARRTLAADGVEVVADIANGAQTQSAVTRWRPDVVLLDIGLPDVDGLEVARRLRAEPGGPLVILISTRDVAYGRRAASGLAAGYVRKDELSLKAILEFVDAEP
jgi:DNA-binding NarL/FixJ family response regulator